MYKDDLMYTSTHEWVRISKKNKARIGIAEHAQSKLGNILFVQLPEIDSEHEQFDSCAVIEAANLLTEVYSPLSGKILNINYELEDDPGLINQDPYDDGWLFEIEIYDEDELDDLMDYESYQKFLEEGAVE